MRWLVMIGVMVMAAVGVRAEEAAFVPQDAVLSGYEYPYAVAYREVRVKDATYKMAYMDVRPEKPNGKTVVLLHGKNFSGYAWGTTMQALLAQGYRVVVPDQVGFGKSDKPDDLPYSFALLATWTVGLLDDLKIEKAEIVGHSMGGMLATRLALMFPQRVEKLVLVNPIGLEDWKTMVPYRDVNAWYEQELKQTPESLRAYQQKAYYDGKWQPAYDALLAPQAGWTLGKEYARIAWNSALQYDMIFNQPVVYEFKNIKVPTLLIIGTRDRTAIGKDGVPAALKDKIGRYDLLGKKVAKMIPPAKLVEIAGVGHVPQVESFPVYIRALEGFLK